jgi:hypothetical protein
MYPKRELDRLAARKAVLSMRIDVHRAECAEALTTFAAPLEFIDRLLGFLRKIKPVAMLAAGPIGALVGRSESRTLRFFGSIARWAPLIFGGVGSE